jgi:hypothetical protein
MSHDPEDPRKDTMMRHSLALLLLLSTAAATAQQPTTPTFEVGIEVINLTVSVTDSRAATSPT